MDTKWKPSRAIAEEQLLQLLKIRIQFPPSLQACTEREVEECFRKMAFQVLYAETTGGRRRELKDVEKRRVGRERMKVERI